MNYDNFLTDYERARNEFGEFVVVTLTGFQGSVPQILGARMIVTSQGYFSGTVGGGKLEKAAIEKSQQFLAADPRKTTETWTWNLQKDLGMSCGGTVTLLFEHQSTKSTWNIAIFGAGHVSQELVRVLSRLNCHIDVFDTRKEWIEKLPKDIRNITGHIATSLETEARDLTENTFVVVATMGHSTDLPVLKELFNGRKFPYVGVIGSEIKATKLRENLREFGVSTAAVESFYCPIGDDIGDNTPSEIAISIVAQLLRKRGR